MVYTTLKGANILAFKERELDPVKLTNAKPRADLEKLEKCAIEPYKATWNNQTVGGNAKIVPTNKRRTRKLLKINKSLVNGDTARHIQFEVRIQMNINKAYLDVRCYKTIDCRRFHDNRIFASERPESYSAKEYQPSDSCKLYTESFFPMKELSATVRLLQRNNN
ncbi:hypothetical protein FF38_08706 [Lucilia cuprina]|uniref:Uncharacterized protein n=1 Tax=Lucilia cuprina TaxID=7375 RepID=A0A0L0BWP9_LUCCU|nr:hypothetical protein FF38_08706 [Lucilia cuprina]